MVGYEFLLSKIPLRMPELDKPARIKPVTRVEEMADLIAIPKAIPPATDSILPHLLFALKHESVKLAILHEALRLLPAQDIVDAIVDAPAGAYVRRAAYLWEKVHGVELDLPLAGPAGNYVDFFDSKVYFTGQVWERSQKYRINFNGIGPYEFCPVVRRDDELEQEGESILRSLREWATARENEPLVDRVMDWAYLSETRDSYAIENEVPSPEKEKAFLQAMAHLRDRAPLTEGYLVGLQNAVISSPLRAERGLRGTQNWLQRGGRGALGVPPFPPFPGAKPPLVYGAWRAGRVGRPLCPTFAGAHAALDRRADAHGERRGRRSSADQGGAGEFRLRLRPPLHGRQWPALAAAGAPLPAHEGGAAGREGQPGHPAAVGGHEARGAAVPGCVGELQQTGACAVGRAVYRRRRLRLRLPLYADGLCPLVGSPCRGLRDPMRACRIAAVPCR